jgi:CheY-like chemotaxis protein
MGLSTAPLTEATDTVLVVEDEVLIRMVISEYLRHCGYRVIEAASGNEAVMVLEQVDIVVDVVLSDTEMPGAIDGFALAKWVRANKPDVEVILVGSPARAADAAAKLCEAGPTFSKPYEPHIVVDRIKRLLAQRKSPPGAMPRAAAMESSARPAAHHGPRGPA